MMAMFRNLTTYLLGAGETDENVDTNATGEIKNVKNVHADDDASASIMEAFHFDQVENIEDDWIFIQAHQEETKKKVLVRDFVVISDPCVVSVINLGNEDNENEKVNEEYVKLIEWENRLIEHPSMSVYIDKTFESFDFESMPSLIIVGSIAEENDAEAEVENAAALSPQPTTGSSSGKQKTIKSNRNNPEQRPQLLDFILDNRMILRSYHTRRGVMPVAYQQLDPNQFQSNSNRRNKYKNVKKLARVNNDRKCGCKKFM